MRDLDKEVEQQLQMLLHHIEDGAVGLVTVLVDESEGGVSQEVFDFAKAEGLIYFAPGSNRWMPSDAGTRHLMALDAKYPIEYSPEG